MVKHQDYEVEIVVKKVYRFKRLWAPNEKTAFKVAMEMVENDENAGDSEIVGFEKKKVVAAEGGYVEEHND